jgi:hypothetical protein
MTEPRAWARVLPKGAHLLRRGAWYPVANDRTPQLLVLAVGKRTVPVPRDLVQVREQRPELWSIVVRAPADPNIERGTERDLGPIYAVCPICAYRTRLSEEPGDMHCPRCDRAYAVEWDETC